MSEMSPQRKNIVVLAASIAFWSAAGPVLLRHFPRLGVVWVCVIAIAVVYVIVQFVKLKRSEG